MGRCPWAKGVSKSREVFPAPDAAVTTTSSPVGISSERFLRLFWRAPRMTIAGSERRCSMPLFYRLVAEELVGVDRFLCNARGGEHFLHGLHQPPRPPDVIDVLGEGLQMALEHGPVEKPRLAPPGSARPVHFDHGADKVAPGVAPRQRRQLVEEGRVLGTAVGVEQPQVPCEPGK